MYGIGVGKIVFWNVLLHKTTCHDIIYILLYATNVRKMQT